MIRRPAFWSTVGLAASIAVVAGLLFPWGSSTNVQAASILTKLDQQVAQGTLIEVDIESFVDDGVSIDARLQIAKSGVAGDVTVEIVEEGGKADVDVSLGLTDEEGWILIRKLHVPDPKAQLFLTMLGLNNTETLLILPKESLGNDFGLDIQDALNELKSEELRSVFRELVENNPVEGATVEEQADGTLLLTLPINNAEALQALAKPFSKLHGDVQVDVDAGGAHAIDDGDDDGAHHRKNVQVNVHRKIHAHHHAHLHAHGHDGDDLIGSTLKITFDPDVEMVRSVVIDNLGGLGGRLSVAIRDGEVDPALFDSSRVTTPETRIFDLAELEELLGQFGGAGGFHRHMRDAHQEEN